MNPPWLFKGGCQHSLEPLKHGGRSVSRTDINLEDTFTMWNFRPPGLRSCTVVTGNWYTFLMISLQTGFLSWPAHSRTQGYRAAVGPRTVVHRPNAASCGPMAFTCWNRCVQTQYGRSWPDGVCLLGKCWQRFCPMTGRLSVISLNTQSTSPLKSCLECYDAESVSHWGKKSRFMLIVSSILQNWCKNNKQTNEQTNRKPTSQPDNQASNPPMKQTAV